MKPVNEMSADELLAEWRHWWANKAVWKVHEAARVEQLDTELTRRMKETEAVVEETRQKLVERFAHSATTAVVGLWMAHGGRPIESNESPELAKCLFEFFKKIH